MSERRILQQLSHHLSLQPRPSHLMDDYLEDYAAFTAPFDFSVKVTDSCGVEIFLWGAASSLF